MIIATVVVAQAVAILSVPARQATRNTTTLRRVQVNAQTIKSLPGGKSYVVDLTQRGVKHEFDPQAGQIDFKRVVVRTTQGEVAIGSFLEKTFLKGELASFKYTSQSFAIIAMPAGTPRIRSSATAKFTCGPGGCHCVPGFDCLDLILVDGLCVGNLTCSTLSDGSTMCFCARR
jgi:hypothetical protein